MRPVIGFLCVSARQTDDTASHGLPRPPFAKIRLVLGSKGAGSSTTGGDSSRAPIGGQLNRRALFKPGHGFVKNDFSQPRGLQKSSFQGFDFIGPKFAQNAVDKALSTGPLGPAEPGKCFQCVTPWVADLFILQDWRGRPDESPRGAIFQSEV